MKYLFISVFLFSYLNGQEKTFTISFGSCHKHNKPESDQILEAIATENPNVFIWLGDVVYGKDGDAADLTAKYNQLKTKSSYQKLLQQTKVLAIWDDHDYGINNGGSNYKNKTKSLIDFGAFANLNNAEEIVRRGGAYQHYEFTQNDVKISITLLDNRFFRTPYLGEKIAGQISNTQGVLLGDQQWRWLEDILKNSTANIHLFAGGIQFLSNKHRFEKWANYPQERMRFLSLLKKYQIKTPVFLSGDRHHSELSILKEKDIVLADITSSGMTEAISWNSKEPNPYRIGEVVTQNSYASLTVDLNTLKSIVSFHDIRGEKIISKELELAIIGSD